MFDRLKAIPILSAIFFVNMLFRWVSLTSIWKLGECLGSLCYHLMSERRSVIETNLTIVSQATGNFSPNKQLVKAVFQRNCANLTCSLKTYGMTPEQLADYVTIDISPEFSQAIHSGKGAILCLAHMGNWEILTKIAPLVEPSPKQFGAVYRPLDSKTADHYVAKQREKYGCQMFSKKAGVSTLSNFIRNGGILGILADQRAGKARKTNRPFFGVDSARSKLPAVLHLRTGAPLFTVAVSSPKDGRWLIEIKKLPKASHDSESILSTITAGYESAFSEHLLDVFWMHRYWKIKGNSPR
ncbi:lysophospholipid acyltransferase family protein [Rubritalea spongiae]|uniref:Lysophospholipid acyltransferase family protein n=1 Tax=Rubritalea spongiae TaxID=430797 RepID=A0ABW5E490_9BACT